MGDFSLKRFVWQAFVWQWIIIGFPIRLFTAPLVMGIFIYDTASKKIPFDQEIIAFILIFTFIWIITGWPINNVPQVFLDKDSI